VRLRKLTVTPKIAVATLVALVAISCAWHADAATSARAKPGPCAVAHSLSLAGQRAAAKRTLVRALRRDPRLECAIRGLRVLAAHTADRHAGVCAIAESLKRAGRREAARRTLAAGLRHDALLPCAVHGLKTLAKEDAAAAAAAKTKAAALATARLHAKCRRAGSLAQAGAKDEAAALYTEVLKERNLPCGTAGLAALETKSRPARLEAWLTQWTSILGRLAGLAALVAALALLAFAAAFTLLTRPRRSRSWLAAHRPTRRFFRPQLKLAAFTDGSGGQVSADGMTELVRANLTELASPAAGGDGFVLDRRTGNEDLGAAVGELSELAPQFKLLSSVASAALTFARLPRYTLNGALQAIGPIGGGMTLSLTEQKAQEDVFTLWSHDTTTGPGQYHAMAAGAAAWTNFLIREHQGVETPNVTSSAASYAQLHAGLQLELDRQTQQAMRSYWFAYVASSDNVAALLNLAVLDARANQYDRALNWLALARRVISPDTNDRTATPVQLRAEWYQVVYNTAVQHAHRALSRTGELESVARRVPQEASNGARVLTDVLRLIATLFREEGSSPERVVVEDQLEAVTAAREVLVAALETVPKLHRPDESPLSGLRRETLLQFLEETVEPTTALLLVGLATRPDFRIWRVAFEWPDDLEPGAASPAKADAARRSLAADLRADRLDAPALLRFALSAPRSYRADYNLACLLAGHLSGESERVAKALRVLEHALRRAPTLEQIALANWADADPSLQPLKKAGEAAFAELLTRYRPPSLEERERSPAPA
jgi:tetratricopeptide (TPR) repeat protein